MWQNNTYKMYIAPRVALEFLALVILEVLMNFVIMGSSPYNMGTGTGWFYNNVNNNK